MNQRKELGQHWLKDKYSLQAMIESAEVRAGDDVLEIGPGTGLLTDELVAIGANITALEYDHTLAQQLLFKYASNKNVQVIEGDIRKFDFGSLAPRFKIVANIPYYLTANLFRKLIDSEKKPELASLLVQKEVAERASAEAGKMSFVAVALQVFYVTRAGEVVPAHLFEPPPKVDSQILVLQRRETPQIEVDKIEDFLTLVKAGFDQPRKKLISNLLGEVKCDKQVLNKAFEELGIDSSARAQELSTEQWLRMFSLLQKNLKSPLP
jgi:16S rRNA (adenine1518-N6/adenine1519-N6)-dimethyltransferase